MISREEAFALLKKYVREDKLLKHSVAVETILRTVARKLGKDEELWGLTGLLHDLDYEYTQKEPEKHANISAQILEDLLPEEAINAIRGHNYKHTDYLPIASLDKSLIAADAASGLILATALVMPSKTLAEVKIETLMNKFNDTSFARGCSRAKIELCIDVGLDVEAFLKLGLNALKEISGQLGF